jgi:hypothetical protein
MFPESNDVIIQMEIQYYIYSWIVRDDNVWSTAVTTGRQ